MLSTKKRHFLAKVIVRGQWIDEKFEVEAKTNKRAVVYLHVTATDKDSAEKTVIDIIRYNYECTYQVKRIDEIERCYEFEFCRKYKPNNVNAMEASTAFAIFDNAQPYLTGNESFFELTYELDND